MLTLLQGVIPADWMVLVLADRGLYAPWLYRQIVVQGWHAFLRINVGAKACLHGESTWHWLRDWLPALGQQWAQRVSCFVEKKNRLDCTLVLCQETGYEEAWVVVTDLPPEQVHGAWYRLRGWIEGGFKDLKRGQWGWHQTKMDDPARAERLWLVLAVSTLWMVGVGSQAEKEQPSAHLDQLPEGHIARRKAGSGTKGARGRELSWLTRGRLRVIASLCLQEEWPEGAIWAEAWPEQFPPARVLPEEKRKKKQKERDRQRVKRRKRKATQRQRKRMDKGKRKQAA